jgi:protein-S-isoprenylcysteine O-methyltransferase Ste14
MAEPRRVSPIQYVASVGSIVALPAVFFLLAGDLSWVEGWVFMGWLLTLSAITTFWVFLYDPDLLAERFRMPGVEGQSCADLAWMFLMAPAFFAWFAVLGLERRFGWSPPFPAWLEAAGGLLLVPSGVFMFGAYHANTFASAMVRIQSERGHRVITTGVYAIVRHPLYLGASLMFFGVPLLLGSGPGLALGAVQTGLLAIRIVGEERVLAAGLEGYEEYKKKVRYRLLPFVW